MLGGGGGGGGHTHTFVSLCCQLVYYISNWVNLVYSRRGWHIYTLGVGIFLAFGIYLVFFILSSRFNMFYKKIIFISWNQYVNGRSYVEYIAIRALPK